MIELAILGLLWLQTPPPQTPTPVPDPSAAPVALEPGVLPEGTPPEARDAWAALVKALSPELPEGKVPAAVTAFDLTIQTRVKTVLEGGSTQQNDVNLRYRYLGPGFVRTTLLETGVERMRGPDGDWLWDAKKGDLFQLSGREYAEDRRELSQTLSISRNYIALCDPARLRIAKLEVLALPPAGLPQLEVKLSKGSAVPLAATLQWLSITSPDFQVVEPVKSRAPLMFKAQIGLDPKTRLPLLATIWQDERNTRVAETAVLVDLKGVSNYRRIDGRLVPTYFSVHDPQLPSSPFVFQATPRVEVVVNSGASTLSPKLSAADFRPPKK